MFWVVLYEIFNQLLIRNQVDLIIASFVCCVTMLIAFPVWKIIRHHYCCSALVSRYDFIGDTFESVSLSITFKNIIIFRKHPTFFLVGAPPPFLLFRRLFRFYKGNMKLQFLMYRAGEFDYRKILISFSNRQ